MPGAAQCGSSPRRRFRDTEPIINQCDADRQPSSRYTVGGRCRSGGESTCPVSRFGNRDRIAAILPVPARVGLLTDCKGSSDERRVAEFAVSAARNRCGNRRLPLERTGIPSVPVWGGRGAMLTSRSTGLRAKRGSAAARFADADLQRACGPSRWRRRRRAAPAGKTRSFASIVLPAVPTWPAWMCKRNICCMSRTGRFRQSSIALASGRLMQPRSSATANGTEARPATGRRSRDLCTIVRMARRAARTVTVSCDTRRGSGKAVSQRR